MAKRYVIDLGEHAFRHAHISDCGTYRYSLTRGWVPFPTPYVAWIMLNPSKADGEDDDPTIGRTIGFSKKWGYGACMVVNAHAYRETSPRALRQAILDGIDTVGPENDEYLENVVKDAAKVIVAWGTHAKLYGRDLAVCDIVGKAAKVPVECLQVNRDGTPKHPLYCASSLDPFVYEKRA